MNPDATLVFVTCPPDRAEALAQTLVEARVAACVNILPAITSVYRWVKPVPPASEARAPADRPAKDGQAGSNAEKGGTPDGGSEVCREAEALLLIKTAESRVEELKQVVLRNHPYELPEIIGVKLAQGHAPYLQWILDCTT